MQTFGRIIRAHPLLRVPISATVVAVLSISAPGFAASGDPQGAQFQVNPVGSVAAAPALARAASGDFIIAWHGGSDFSAGIYAQGYAADGTPKGAPLTIATGSFTEFLGSGPAVAMDRAGNAVVVWVALISARKHTTFFVRGQRFAADGTPQGPTFDIATRTLGALYPLVGSNPGVTASVVMAANGDFVVSWQRSFITTVAVPYSFLELLSVTDGAISAQRYRANGRRAGLVIPVENDLRFNTFASKRKYFAGYNALGPAIAMDDDGNFVVTWQNENASGHSTVQARRYNALGIQQGLKLSVSPASQVSAVEPSISRDAAGNFVIAWLNYTEDLQSQPTAILDARRYDAKGRSQGALMEVTAAPGTHTAIPDTPAIAMQANGDFVLAWTSLDYAGPPYESDIRARAYAADGTASAAEIAVNSIAGSQRDAAVAVDGYGDFVVAWTDPGIGGSSPYVVRAQRFAGH